MILEARTGLHHSLHFQAFQPKDFGPDLDRAIAKAKKRIEVLRQAPASFETIVVGLEEATEEIDYIHGTFSNLLGAEANDELMELAQSLGPKVSDFYNDILLDEDLYRKVQEVYSKKESLNLTIEQQTVLDNLHSDFERRGAKLKEAPKKRLKEIDQRLAQLSPQFGQNVLKSTNEFQLIIENEDELKGLPEAAMEAAAQAAKDKGKEGSWLFTLHQPSYLPIMKFAESRPLREKMWRAYNRRAYKDGFDNRQNIKEIVTLQREKADILGYPTFAHFTLEKRMAEDPQTAYKFLQELLDASLPAARKDFDDVQAYARSCGGPESLKPWDFSFYSEKLKNEKYSYDEETLRPYFKLENVVAGAFEHARLLYGLKFQKSDKYSVYHPEVEVFEVTKEDSGDFVGLFYADFFPRAGKRQGAWMTEYLTQGLFQKQVVRPHVTIVCNFTRPTKTKPSLLSFGEVNTLFHEFGHSLHGLLSQCQFRSVAGPNVYWDFVELPSQIMENWILESESLRLFAKHYQTGEVIPQELIEKIKASDRFQTGYLSLRQLSLAYLDMAWYTTDPKDIQDVSDFEIKVLRPLSLFEPNSDTCISTAFGHIFAGGYASGYYSYKWAEALEADAFELFKEKGIFNKEVAQAFETHILSKGGTEHPAKLYERFRGRPADPKALLRRDGLLTQ